jgi:hypothetical protein
MFSAYHEYGKNPMALSCHPSDFYGPYTMDRNNYIKIHRISNFVVLSFSVITDDLTLSSKDQNVFCIVNCKEDYDHLKLASKPIFQKINIIRKSKY